MVKSKSYFRMNTSNNLLLLLLLLGVGMLCYQSVPYEVSSWNLLSKVTSCLGWIPHKNPHQEAHLAYLSCYDLTLAVLSSE